MHWSCQTCAWCTKPACQQSSSSSMCSGPSQTGTPASHAAHSWVQVCMTWAIWRQSVGQQTVSSAQPAAKQQTRAATINCKAPIAACEGALAIASSIPAKVHMAQNFLGCLLLCVSEDSLWTWAMLVVTAAEPIAACCAIKCCC